MLYVHVCIHFYTHAHVCSSEYVFSVQTAYLASPQILDVIRAFIKGLLSVIAFNIYQTRTYCTDRFPVQITSRPEWNLSLDVCALTEQPYLSIRNISYAGSPYPDEGA